MVSINPVTTRESLRMAKVRIEGLTKRFGETVAVNHLTLEIGDGEFVSLLGPSGCGKTTTLRCIAGLERQDEGDIYIGDSLINDLSVPDRNIAMVFQFPVVYPGMTVRENLEFPLRQRGQSKSEVREKVEGTAKMLRIERSMEEMASDLDVGGRQRVALGRALVRSPEVLLLDEALTNLDTRLKLMMIDEVKRLHEELRQTTVYVTHDQSEAMMMADRIAVMDKGFLKQYDSPENLYRNPRNLFVAGFVGSPPMNFIQVTFDEERGCIVYGDFSIDVPELISVIGTKAAGPEILLGFRPEYVSVHKVCPSKKHVKGKVELAEFVGDYLFLDVQLDAIPIKVSAPGDLGVGAGDDVCIEFTKFHLFDKKTGEAIL